MPQDHRTSKAEFPLAEAQRRRAEGQPYRAIAKAIGWSMPQTRRYLRGEVHLSEPQSEPTTAPVVHPTVHYGSPDIARQSDVDALATRVEVLEAFIATLQQHPTYPSGSPNGSPMVHPVHSGSPGGSPTHKRGFVMADDLFDAIHTYAKAHHLQVKDVLDTALRRFFAQVGEEVRHDG